MRGKGDMGGVRGGRGEREWRQGRGEREGRQGRGERREGEERAADRPDTHTRVCHLLIRLC